MQGIPQNILDEMNAVQQQQQQPASNEQQQQQQSPQAATTGATAGNTPAANSPSKLEIVGDAMSN